MYSRASGHHSHPERPVERRDVLAIAGRIVELETMHVGESVWVARGRVSEPLPSGPRLRSPVEITATGESETAAISTLCQRVEDLPRNPLA